MERWYFIRNGIRVGPVALEQLLELVRSGELQPTHKLMKENSGRWRPASETPGLFGGQATGASVPPPARSDTPMPLRPQPAVPASSAALARPAGSPVPPAPAAGSARPPAAPAKPAAPSPAPVAARVAVPAKPAAPAAASPPAAPVKPTAAPVASTPPAPARPPVAGAPARPPAAAQPAAPARPAVSAPAASAPTAPAPAKPPVPIAKPAVPPPTPAVVPAPVARPAAVPPSLPVAKPAAPPVPSVSGWLYMQGQKKQGPVSTADLKKLAETGVLKAGDMVMRGGQDKWRAASEVPGLFPPVAAVAAPAPVAAAAPVVAAPAPVAPVAVAAPAPVAAKASHDDDDDDEADDASDDGEIDVDEFIERAEKCKSKGNYAGATAEYDLLVKMLPDEPEGYNGLARLWATCPDAKVRNGAKAVEYARMAVELASNAESAAEDEEDIEDSVALRLECQETLAIAQAETGNFTAALATLDDVLDDADRDDRRRLKKLRQQFEAKQPVRE